MYKVDIGKKHLYSHSVSKHWRPENNMKNALKYRFWKHTCVMHTRDHAQCVKTLRKVSFLEIRGKKIKLFGQHHMRLCLADEMTQL